MTTFVHLFIRSIIHLKKFAYDIKHHVTLNNIFSVVYTNDQQTPPILSPHDTWLSTTLTNISARVHSTMLQGVRMYYTMVYELIQVYKNDTWH